jgi:hypothetical protein
MKVGVRSENGAHRVFILSTDGKVIAETHTSHARLTRDPRFAHRPTHNR